MTSDPTTLPDLDGPAQVEDLVRCFYRDVAQDELLGPMFTVVAGVNWNDHVAKLTDFWSRTLFGIGDYAGNPLAAHERIHGEREFTDAHFHRWLELFAATVDVGWSGPGADKVKRVAAKIARLHRRKLVGESGCLVDQDGESLLVIETKHPA